MFRHIFKPSDPAGTQSATGVMMGLGIEFTPDTTGALLISVDGSILAPSFGGGAEVALFGAEVSGPLPANGDPVSGVQLSAQPISTVAGQWVPFSLHTYVKVTAGVPTWTDLVLVSGDIADHTVAQVKNLVIVVVEI